jgi:hypothetical protein
MTRPIAAARALSALTGGPTTRPESSGAPSRDVAFCSADRQGAY